MRVADPGRERAFADGRAVLDGEDRHRHLGLVVVVEAHLAHEPVVLDLRQRRPHLLGLGRPRVDDRPREQLERLVVGEGVDLGGLTTGLLLVRVDERLVGRAAARARSARATSPPTTARTGVDPVEIGRRLVDGVLI